MLLSENILFLYIFIWFITFIIYYKKKKSFDIGGLLILVATVFSIFSLLLYKNPYSDYHYMKLTIFPFVYLYSMQMLTFYPVIKFQPKKILSIQHPSKWLIDSISILFIISAFLLLPNLIRNLDKLHLLLVDNDIALEFYQGALSKADQMGRGGISNLPAIIVGAYANVGVLFLFYYLTKKKHNKIFIISLFIASIVDIISSLKSGTRGAIYYKVVTFVSTYFIFRNQLSTKVNKIVKRTGGVFMIIIFFMLVVLTIGRFGDEKALSSVVGYLGQQNLNFNQYAFDNGGFRYGDRCFPLFKILMGFNDVPHNFIERRYKYPNLHINDEAFITYIGDFVLDFGPIIASLIFLTFTLLSLKYIKIEQGILKFHHLILLHFIVCVCIQGSLSLFSFADIAGNIKLVFTFLLYIVFKLDDNLQRYNYNLKTIL